MILKRMLVAALGALGLGALASGPAFGQAPGSSNIPAPNVFDDQITCTQLLPNLMGNMGYNMPSAVPMGGMTSPLDDIIGMGMNMLDATTLAAITTLTDGAAKLEGLGYVVPPTDMNCGAGTAGPMLIAPSATAMNNDANTDGDFLDAGDTLIWGSIPEDVADGYTELLGKYTTVYGAPGGTTGGTLRALEDAQKVLDDTDATLTALVEARTTARNTARDVHNKALAAFNVASQGPIYQAAVEEWNAKAAVTQSIADYNEQVGKTNTARNALDAMEYSNYTSTGDGTTGSPITFTQGRSKYVPLGNTELFEGATAVVTITNGMGMVNENQLIQYTNSDLNTPQVGTPGMAGLGMGDGSAGNDAPVASDTTASNFTATGQLIVPMELNTDTADNPIDIRTVVDADNDAVSAIRTRVENVRIAAAALKKARDEYVGTQQDIYDEAYRRAKLEQDYYDALWAQVLADTTDTRSIQDRLRYTDGDNSGINEDSERVAGNINQDYEPAPVTIASRNAAYSSESAKRMAEETSLRGLVAQREAATADVVSHFTNAQSFYQQLVDRRTALKNAADAAAPEGATELTTAQENANKALMTARTEKEKIDALYPDDPSNPTVDLVSTLLKTGGDDGQALVDAISSTYDGTQTNRDDIDALKGQLTDADGNPIDLSNLGNADEIMALTTDVSTNTTDIGELDGRVTENEDDIAQINSDLYGTTSSQHADASACAEGAGGLVNIANCADARSRHNEEDIADLGGDIEALDGRVGDNEDDIATNAENIKTNAGNISMNAEDIATNAGNISMNAEDIATNAGNISMNAEDIATNAGNISMNAEDIATNAGNISMNAEDIMTNAGNISMNAEDIMANAEAIVAEASERMGADMMLAGAIEEAVAAGAAADMALSGRIGSNADAIAANMNSIGQNASAISDNRNMIGELSDDLDVVRAGVAASMALAGMPAVNGRGIAIGVGSFDGESAFAVGFQIQGEQASFKIGVTSSGGATGASAGVGFNF